MEIFTKEKLIEKLSEIRNIGWIKNARPGNSGGVGNTLEDLLGIQENNLPIPNAAEWELKCQRKDTTSLTTLFHMEPSPRALKFVPKVLLPLYGWKHQTIDDEMSFRQTISGNNYSDRGFIVKVSKEERKVVISFNKDKILEKQYDWLKLVEKRVGLNEINPQPYWGFDDLFHKAGTKLLNCFYIRAEVKKDNNEEYFHYNEIKILQKFSLNKFLEGIEQGFVYVDFDARTHHNHGTKFRLRQDKIIELYDIVKDI